MRGNQYRRAFQKSFEAEWIVLLKMLKASFKFLFNFSFFKSSNTKMSDN